MAKKLGINDSIDGLNNINDGCCGGLERVNNLIFKKLGDIKDKEKNIKMKKKIQEYIEKLRDNLAESIYRMSNTLNANRKNSKNDGSNYKSNEKQKANHKDTTAGNSGYKNKTSGSQSEPQSELHQIEHTPENIQKSQRGIALLSNSKDKQSELSQQRPPMTSESRDNNKTPTRIHLRRRSSNKDNDFTGGSFEYSKDDEDDYSNNNLQSQIQQNQNQSFELNNSIDPYITEILDYIRQATNCKDLMRVHRMSQNIQQETLQIFQYD